MRHGDISVMYKIDQLTALNCPLLSRLLISRYTVLATKGQKCYTGQVAILT